MDIELPQIDDYRSLFLNGTALLDVRAPIEYLQGAFPFTENHPLINDHERAEIGACYKNHGQEAAIRLGHKLVQGSTKSQRIKEWQDFIERNPQGILFCFRGGMRSKISQQWIYEETGVIFPRIKGGYKAMRRYLIDQLELSSNTINPIMLGGRTGIGKTVLLNKLKQKIDLEGIFHHRGSVFGQHVTQQPSQIDIENTLSIELIKLLDNGHKYTALEDEGANIGSRRITEQLFAKMKQAPIVLLEASIEERVDITFQEYIVEALAEHQAYHGEQTGFDSWAKQLHSAFDKIQRRLGGARHKELKKILDSSIQHQINTNDNAYHKNWIQPLLADYYDPMYDFQLSKKLDRVVFKGDYNAVSDFLKSQYNIS